MQRNAASRGVRFTYDRNTEFRYPFDNSKVAFCEFASLGRPMKFFQGYLELPFLEPICLFSGGSRNRDSTLLYFAAREEGNK